MNTDKPIQVLLVEDNPTDVLLTKEALEGGRTKFQVVDAESLGQALDLLHAQLFDVILLDLGLPDSQGLDTLRQIRSTYSDLPVVVMTGTDDDEMAVKTVHEGAQDYLVKGQVQNDILVRTIRYAIERSRIRADLRHSEERFRLLVESVKDHAILVLDPQGRVVTWNEGAKRLKGYIEDEILYQSFAVFYTKEERDKGKPAQLLQAAVKHGHVRDEGWRVRKDGSTFWAEIEITALHDGKLTGFSKVTHDITERRQAEQDLRQSEALYRCVAENISAILWVLDAKASKCLYISPAYETIFHRSCDSIYANLSSHLDSVHPEDREIATSFLDCLVRDGQAEAQYRLQRADGSIRWLWARGSAIKSQAGVVERLAGIGEDVTDRKKTELASALLAAIVKCCEDAIVCETLDGNVIQWNAGAERLYGYTVKEMLGKTALILYPPGQADEYASIIERIKRGESIRANQTRRRRKDGKIIEVLISVAPLIDANNLIEGATVISHDLTEILNLQEQFRQAQKMEAVGRLAGGVAHDFNNLLTIISGYTDIVLRKLPIGDPTRELVSEIGKAGERAAGLTRQLLAFSRKTVLQPNVLDLNAVITDSLKMLRRLVGEDVDVNTVLYPSIGRAKVDLSQIEQAIVNLAVNARDAMPEGGKITFETANIELDEAYCLANPTVTPGRYVMLAASDNGTGMSEETKARIFEPFFTTKEEGKGTGLGLAMVYGFIKQSGGHIAVYSELNMGTTFKLYLPLVQEEVRKSKSHPGFKIKSNGTETILLVEDEDGVRALARHILQECGYTVLDARNGVEALRLAVQHQGPIHLLLTDVVMPGMSGRLVAERMGALKPAIKIVFTSGYTDDAVVRHGILETETHFLQKPYTPAAVAQKVREVLDS